MSKETTSSTGANLGYEQKLWQAADKLRSKGEFSLFHLTLNLLKVTYIYYKWLK